MKKVILFLSLCFFGVFISCTSESAKTDVEELNKKADSLSSKLNSPELKTVNAELLKNTNDASLYDKRSRIYQSLKQFNEAINDSKRAIKIDSTKSEFHMTLVDAYFSQNSTRMAKELLEIMEKKFPDNTPTLLKLSEMFFLVRQYQKAIDYANKALKIDENLAKAYYLKGSIYRESGDTAKAISSLETATEQDNKFEDAFYDLGVIYAARKNPIAFEYYDNTLKINPYNANARYARAKLLQDLNKIDEAIKEYENIISKDASCYNCYYNLGAIYLEIKKDNKKALEKFTKAIELNPSYTEAYFARGFTYAKLKDKENAKADYSTCLKIQPNYDAAIQGLNNL